jgi:predicted NBD/HSP70 family sugar kinase
MARPSGISQEDLRRRNVSALLSRVHTAGAITRAELTHELGLNRSTIGDITGLLEELGLVSEVLPGPGRRSGRPSLVVQPRRDVTVLAVGIGVDRITVALVGLGGQTIIRRDWSHQRSRHGAKQVALTVAHMSHELLAGKEARRCLGAGVSVPGAVRATDGTVRFAPNLGWHDEPFTQMLAEELSLPVATGNDADLGMLAEHLRGAAIGFDNVAYINGSVGIGGGFLVGGVPLRGGEGYAGEIGHVPVDSQGGECRCGAVGCWETKVGENFLLTAAGRLPGGGPSAVAGVIEAAESGDAKADTALTSVAFWTGVGLRVVINIFNPSVIVLGGLLAHVWETRQDLMLASLHRQPVLAPLSNVEIRVGSLGDDASLVGAAELAFAPLIGDPLRLVGAAAGA